MDGIIPSRKASRRRPGREVSAAVVPELPPLPALTRAEAELIDGYLDVVDLLGRINPAHHGDTYRGLRAAQALVSKATALRDALTLMHQRGESELHAADARAGAARPGRGAPHGARHAAAARRQLTPGPAPVRTARGSRRDVRTGVETDPEGVPPFGRTSTVPPAAQKLRGRALFERNRGRRRWSGPLRRPRHLITHQGVHPNG